MNRLEEIKGRLNNATPGPWCPQWEKESGFVFITDRHNSYALCRIFNQSDSELDANVNFIANSPSDIEYLLSKLEIAEKALETVFDYLKQTDQELTKQTLLKALKQIRE